VEGGKKRMGRRRRMRRGSRRRHGNALLQRKGKER